MGAKNLLSRFVAVLSDQSESRVSPDVNPLTISVPVQGDLLRRHYKTFENLPEDIR